jgi:hypothetical protein
MPFKVLLDSLYAWLVAGRLPKLPSQQFCYLLVEAQVAWLIVWQSGSGFGVRMKLLDGFHGS